ncbi:hypothetical protein Tco_1404302 [Tanacetum coccineum]
MSNLKFAETYKLVAFLEKPKESDGFEGIIDFLNASSIRYVLTIQALLDGKKVIITETSMGRALQLKDAEGSEIPTDPQHTPTIIQPSTSQPQKKQPRRKQRKDIKVSGSTEPITDEAANEEHVPVHSNDPLLSGEDRLKLNELMELCTNLSQRVLDLENTKTSQAAKITKLKEKVKKLKKRNKSRTPGLKRLSKVGRFAQVVSSEDEEVTLVDEAQERNNDNLMFDTRVLNKHEVEVEKVVSIAEVTTASATTTVDELTMAQTLIEIKAAKTQSCLQHWLHNTTAVTIPTARRFSFKSTHGQKKKHFAKPRAEKIKETTTNQAKKRNQTSVDSFVPMDTEVVEGSKSQAEGSSKRTGEEFESDNSKKQKIDENVEAEVDDEAEMKKHMEIVPDDEVAIDAIPLATKSPIIVDWKIIKEGKMGYFQIIRADGSSRRYSSMIRMLQNIDREDLETLQKLVKAKHINIRPEKAYERVLWGDLKVMFEPDVESEVWRNLQGYNVTVWKLFSSSGVHFVRF